MAEHIWEPISQVKRCQNLLQQLKNLSPRRLELLSGLICAVRKYGYWWFACWNAQKIVFKHVSEPRHQKARATELPSFTSRGEILGRSFIVFHKKAETQHEEGLVFYLTTQWNVLWGSNPRNQIQTLLELRKRIWKSTTIQVYLGKSTFNLYSGLITGKVKDFKPFHYSNSDPYRLMKSQLRIVHISNSKWNFLS